MRIACKRKSTGSGSQALKTNSELDNFNEAFKTFGRADKYRRPANLPVLLNEFEVLTVI